MLIAMLMFVMSAAPAFAAQAAPGNSDFVGQGSKTANFAPASSPGNS